MKKVAEHISEEDARDFARKPVAKSVLSRLLKAIHSRAEYHQMAKESGLKKPKKYARKMRKKQWEKLTPGRAVTAMAETMRQGKTGFPVKPPAQMAPEHAQELQRRKQAARAAISKTLRHQVNVVQYAGHEPHSEGGHSVVYNPPLPSRSEKPRFDSYKKNRTGKVEKIAVHPSYIAGSTHGLYTVHTPKGKFAFIAPHDAIQQLARHSGMSIHKERLGKSLGLAKAIRTVQYAGFTPHPSGEGHALLFHPPSPSGKIGVGGSGSPGRTSQIKNITRHAIAGSNTHGFYSVHTESGNSYDFHAPHAEMNKLSRATGKQIEGASRSAVMSGKSPSSGKSPTASPAASSGATPTTPHAATSPSAYRGMKQWSPKNTTAPGNWQPSPKGAPGSLGRLPVKSETPKPSGTPKPSASQVLGLGKIGAHRRPVSSTPPTGASSSIPATPPGTEHGKFQSTHETSKGKGILFASHDRPGKVRATGNVTSLKHVNDVQGSEATHGVYHATNAFGGHFRIRMPHRSANGLARNNKLGSTGRPTANPKATSATKPKASKVTTGASAPAATPAPALAAQGRSMRRWKMQKARKPTLASQAGLPEPGGLHKGKHGQIVITKTRKKDPKSGEMLYHVQGNIKDASGKLAVINHTGYTHFGAAMFAHHVQHGDIYNEGWLRRRLEGVKVPQVKKAIEAEFSLFEKAMQKDSKAHANYREGTENKCCGECEYFDGKDGCSKVTGLIRPEDLCDWFEREGKMEKAQRKIPDAKEFKPKEFSRLKDESEVMKQGPHPGPAAHETVPALAKWGTKKWVPEYDPTDDKRAKELTSYQVRLTHGVYHIHPREFNPSGAQEYLLTFFGRDGTPQYVSGPKGCPTPAAAVREAKKHYEKVTTGWISKALEDKANRKVARSQGVKGLWNLYRHHLRNRNSEFSRNEVRRIEGQTGWKNGVRKSQGIAKAVLTAAKRHRLKRSQFGLPGKEAYPMPDKSHAANAKSRATQMRKKGKLSEEQEERIDRKANRVLGKGIEMEGQEQEQPKRLPHHNAVVLDVTLKGLLRKAQGQKLGPVTRRNISEPNGARDQAHDADGQHFGPTSGRSVNQATGRKDQAHADDGQDPGPSTRSLTNKYTKKNRTGSQPERVGRREGALTTGREEPDRIIKPKIRRES